MTATYFNLEGYELKATFDCEHASEEYIHVVQSLCVQHRLALVLSTSQTRRRPNVINISEL